MKRQGTISLTCFSGPEVIFPEGDRMTLTELPKGFSRGDKVEITLVDIDDSATYNMEHSS